MNNKFDLEMNNQFDLDKLGDLSGLLKQAEQMRKQVAEAHNELKTLTVVGKSGDTDANVEAHMNGQRNLLRLHISTGCIGAILAKVLEGYQLESYQLQEIADTLSPIIVSAANDAMQKVDMASINTLNAAIEPNFLNDDVNN